MLFCDINIPASHGYICRKHVLKTDTNPHYTGMVLSNWNFLLKELVRTSITIPLFR